MKQKNQHLAGLGRGLHTKKKKKSVCISGPILIFLTPIFFQYVDQIVMSQTLARVLAQVCSKKLSTLYSAAEQMQSEQQNQGTSSSNKTSSTSVPSPVPSITPERYIIYVTTVLLIVWALGW